MKWKKCVQCAAGGPKSAVWRNPAAAVYSSHGAPEYSFMINQQKCGETKKTSIIFKLILLRWWHWYGYRCLWMWLSIGDCASATCSKCWFTQLQSTPLCKRWDSNKAQKIVMSPTFRPRSLSNWMLQAWWWQRYLWHHQHSQILLWYSRCPTRWNMYPWRLLTTETFPICFNK